MQSEWREQFLRNLARAETLSALIGILGDTVRLHGAELQSDTPEERSAYTALLLSQIQRLSRISAPAARALPATERAQMDRLIELGDLLLIRTDSNFRITEVNGNAERLLGVTVQELKTDPLVWRRFLDARDIRNLRLMLRSASLTEDLRAEIRVVNRREGRSRWLLLRGVPLLSSAYDAPTGAAGVRRLRHRYHRAS